MSDEDPIIKRLDELQVDMELRFAATTSALENLADLMDGQREEMRTQIRLSTTTMVNEIKALSARVDRWHDDVERRLARLERPA